MEVDSEFLLQGIMNPEFTSAGFDIFIDILALSSLVVLSSECTANAGMFLLACFASRGCLVRLGMSCTSCEIGHLVRDCLWNDG